MQTVSYLLHKLIEIFFFCLDEGIPAPISSSQIRLYRRQNYITRDLRLLYSHRLNSNPRPFIKLKETHIISLKPPVVNWDILTHDKNMHKNLIHTNLPPPPSQSSPQKNQALIQKKCQYWHALIAFLKPFILEQWQSHRILF